MCKVKICIDNKDVVMDDECIYDVESSCRRGV